MPGGNHQESQRVAPHNNDKHATTRWFEFNKNLPMTHFRGNRTRTSKYTVLTYLPKALWEQYRRIANIYFTIVAAVSLTSISPLNPVTTFLPLVLVIGVSLVKEAFEDVKRHKADNIENNRITEVYDPEQQAFVPRKWFEVKVGDVVRVKKDEPMCADLVLLTSHTNDGVAYVETMNLDGETNLKLRKALDATQHFTDAHLAGFSGAIECEKPNASLYTFSGNIHLTLQGEQKVIPVTPQAILLRGSNLRNTNQAVGIAIFTGHDTKVFMNARPPPSKRSTIERSIDYIIYFMFCLLFTICVIGGVWNAILTKDKYDNMWYLDPFNHVQAQFNPKHPPVVGAIAFVTSFVLYGYLIPISLYVSIEIVKLAQIYFIMRDTAMYHEESKMFALARTSNLNEELGMIQCVLSDKTGTLTRNEMEFFKCSINGIPYGRGVTEIERAVARRTGKKLNTEDDLPVPPEFKAKGFNFFDDRLMNGKWCEGDQKAHVYEFLRCLAICHTVVPEGEAEEIKATHQVKYEAESPDEAALLMAAKQLGLMFFRRSTDTIGLLEAVDGVEIERTYEILNILEFNSTRKRMSVIFRDQQGRIMMYCKGADTVIYERLSAQNDPKMLSQTRSQLEHYGDAGLRTLCLSYCELDPTEYDAWNQQFVLARTAIENREKKLMDVYEMIEKDLILLGCTAIEDKLQVGVPETIAKLLEAGIRVWMLTGDKLETAVNIGFACSLLDNNMMQHMVSSETPEVVAAESARNMELAAQLAETAVKRQLDEALAKIEQTTAREAAASKRTAAGQFAHNLSLLVRPPRDDAGASQGQPHALIIDGKALAFALKNPENRELIWKIGSKCASVICCRVSPMQKGQVTALVKGQGLRTLGIGDGANDVAMIQEADIGVGISGLEGRQAVMASDFAIAQFRFLQTLLLVHGRWCYKRIARMVNFFFYKNIVFGLTLFYFNGCSFFSGGLTYDEFYISLYNVIFTSVTPLMIGIFDQDVPRRVSLKYPGLYRQGPRNEYFSLQSRFWWFSNGFYQSAVTFVGVLYANRLVANRPGGFVVDNWHNGIVMFSVVIWTVHLQIASILDYWNWLHHLGIWGSVLLWYVFLLGYGNLPSVAIFNYNIRFMFENMVANCIHYWFVILLIPVLNLLPHFLITCALRRIAPGDHIIVQEYLAKHDRAMLREEDDATPEELLAHPRDFYLSMGGASSRKQSAFVPDALDVDPENKVIRDINGANERDPNRHRNPFPGANGATSAGSRAPVPSLSIPPSRPPLVSANSGYLSPGAVHSPSHSAGAETFQVQGAGHTFLQPAAPGGGGERANGTDYVNPLAVEAAHSRQGSVGAGRVPAGGALPSPSAYVSHAAEPAAAAPGPSAQQQLPHAQLQQPPAGHGPGAGRYGSPPAHPAAGLAATPGAGSPALGQLKHPRSSAGRVTSGTARDPHLHQAASHGAATPEQSVSDLRVSGVDGSSPSRAGNRASIGFTPANAAGARGGSVPYQSGLSPLGVERPYRGSNGSLQSAGSGRENNPFRKNNSLRRVENLEEPF